MESNTTLELSFDATKHNLEQAVNNLVTKAEQLVASGTTLLILSDREIAADKLVIPAVMALGAIHNHLVNKVGYVLRLILLLKRRLLVIHTIFVCYLVLVRRQFIRI